jgi:hypothetical protein
VFENELAELAASAATLTAAEANEHALILAETRRLHIVAHWADLHAGDPIVQSRIPGTEHPVWLGGEGTPTVGDFAPAELGCALRISDGAAVKLMAGRRAGATGSAAHAARGLLQHQLEAGDRFARRPCPGRLL